MAATRENTIRSNNLTTALTAVTAGDDVWLSQWSDDYTAGIDLTAYDLASFITLPGYSGSIGADGSQLKLLATAGPIILNSASRVINLYNAGTNLRVEVRLTVPGTVNVHGGTVTTLVVHSGFANVYDTCDANTVHVGDGGQVNLQPSAQTTNNLNVRGNGKAWCSRTLTNAEVSDSGELTVDYTVAPSLTMKGGKYFHKSNAAPTLVELHDCTLDFSEVRKSFTTGGNPTFGANVRIIRPRTPGVTVTIGGTVTRIGNPEQYL